MSPFPYEGDDQMKKTKWIKFLGGNSLLYTALVLFLISLTILILTQIDFIFTPLIVILSNVLMPFIIAILFYYLLKPAVSFLTKHNVKQTWAVTIVFLALIAILAVSIAVLFPIIGEQIQNLFEIMPVFINDIFNGIQDLIQNLPANDIIDQVISWLQGVIDTFFNNFGQILSSSLSNVSGFVSGVTNVFFTLAVAPIILFFLLKDEEKIVNGLLFVTPPKWRQGLIRVGTEINLQVGAYIKGQFTIAVINGVMMYFGFTMIGLSYAGALGVLGGILSIIPYIGPTLTFIPALIIAAFDSFTTVLLLIVVWLVIQFVEGNLIEPNIMGKQLEVHPVTIIVMLLVMGDLFGLFGLVFGIPMYAILKVIVAHFYRSIKMRYNEYFGDDAGEFKVDTWESDEFGDEDILETKESYVQYLYNRQGE